MWQSLTPEKQPLVAPIETSHLPEGDEIADRPGYQSVLTQTVGPAALDLDAYCSMKARHKQLSSSAQAVTLKRKQFEAVLRTLGEKSRRIGPPIAPKAERRVGVSGHQSS